MKLHFLILTAGLLFWPPTQLLAEGIRDYEGPGPRSSSPTEEQHRDAISGYLFDQDFAIPSDPGSMNS